MKHGIAVAPFNTFGTLDLVVLPSDRDRSCTLLDVVRDEDKPTVLKETAKRGLLCIESTIGRMLLICDPYENGIGIAVICVDVKRRLKATEREFLDACVRIEADDGKETFAMWRSIVDSVNALVSCEATELYRINRLLPDLVTLSDLFFADHVIDAESFGSCDTVGTFDPFLVAFSYIALLTGVSCLCNKAKLTVFFDGSDGRSDICIAVKDTENVSSIMDVRFLLKKLYTRAYRTAEGTFSGIIVAYSVKSKDPSVLGLKRNDSPSAIICVDT